MPHVIVKLWPGETEQQKIRLAEAITKDVMDSLHDGEQSVSVAIEEIQSQDWLGLCSGCLRDFRTRCTNCLAYASARADVDRNFGLRLGAA